MKKIKSMEGLDLQIKKNEKKRETFLKKYYFVIILFAILIINAMSISLSSYLINLTNYRSVLSVAKKNTEIDVTQKIGDLCLLKENKLNQVYCVVHVTNYLDIYKYKPNNDTIDIQELIINGGDCKSWTAYYMGIFKYMGIKTKTISSENHVYLNAYTTDFHCEIDQLNINCVNLKEE